MNPEGYPGEAVPLQGGRYDGFSGQPSAPTMVQYTTVNITTDPPQDHIVWSLCCFVYLNPLCLGLAALIYSIKARDRKVAGDLEGARHYGSTARCLNIVSTVLVSITIFTVIILFAWIVNEINYYRYHYNFKPNFK
ncbi:dispanin subfamily A member 2b-like [Thunnus maccoyii]|uniref:dispanin subfamily A member 2b-like n=1 Tax=Thunnus maccoyii TaxID=8240 RepID=UPI001C4C84A0|nr:dispanin subfamily A member 2b-like [Thunnus maccoyii]XP_042268225.1 dispanin subfamily A member 2b-like [Thunnus maccoyii]